MIIEFEKGIPVAVWKREPASLLRELNRLGGKHGIGRIDIVETFLRHEPRHL